ncbi:hypothetical protein BS78_07G206600 [Paspalum vaginatum]|nr:hypothetical protein BS78_07G206600 [Paspalum vaginatum]
MGASQSISGHHSHREGPQHLLKRVRKNEARALCGMCSQHAEIGEVAYRCRSCGFVVHDDCYRLPEKMNCFAHSVHPLTLRDRSTAPAAGGRTSSCSICAVAFHNADGAAYFVYGCNRCHGFYAHPRCCGLPPTVRDSALHQHALTLLPPRARRRCLNAGKCRNAKRWQKNDAAAWSYQCSTCNVEVCLACQLPQDHKVWAINDVVITVGAVAEDLATAVGKVLHALCSATLFGSK